MCLLDSGHVLTCTPYVHVHVHVVTYPSDSDLIDRIRRSIYLSIYLAVYT